MSSILRRAALAALCFFAPFAANGASTTNFSDQWWVPSESGWGASVLQQKDVLFIDLFVYDAGGVPIWYTAAAYLQAPGANGHIVFTGDLYQTNGPWFGGPFNPASVTSHRVGSLTFDASSSDTAALFYSVNGVNVVKDVTRQLWAYEDFSGSYQGGLVYDLSNCSNPSNNGHVEELGPIVISQTGNTAFAMTTQSSLGTCNWNATYSQLGHMGTAAGTFACNNGIQGSFTAFELEKTLSGMTGRIVASDNFCQLNGRLGGVLR
jgi:hypothetical protein